MQPNHTARKLDQTIHIHSVNGCDLLYLPFYIFKEKPGDKTDLICNKELSASIIIFSKLPDYNSIITIGNLEKHCPTVDYHNKQHVILLAALHERHYYESGLSVGLADCTNWSHENRPLSKPLTIDFPEWLEQEREKHLFIDIRRQRITGAIKLVLSAAHIDPEVTITDRLPHLGAQNNIISF